MLRPIAAPLALAAFALFVPVLAPVSVLAQDIPSYARPDGSAPAPQPPPQENGPQEYGPQDNGPMQPAPAPQSASGEAGPAGPGVARISLLTGEGSVERGDSKDRIAAAVNAPLLAGDYFSTGDDSRAEIQFDDVSMLRLGSGVQLHLTNLDPQSRELELASGTVEIAMLRGGKEGPQIDTPSIAVRPNGTGDIRVTVNEDGTTYVTVRRGKGFVATNDDSRPIGEGTTIVASGPADKPSVDEETEISEDGFDRFNSDRDAQITTAFNQPNFNPGIDGYSDLSAAGQWENVPSYGEVWTPNEPAGWAPYHDGRWAWEEDYGWTWIGYEPWGWAPYHYGRWAYVGTYGWAWVPPVRSRPGFSVSIGFGAPVWRPALVGFVTFGSGNVGVNLGFGSVGWVPLAPREAYRPWYGPRAVNVVNVNVTNVTNVYRNIQYRGALTAVDAHSFETGNFTHPAFVNPHEISNVAAVHGAVPIVPTAANLRYSNRPVSSRVAFSQSPGGAHFAGSAHAVERVPFVQQRDTISNYVRPSGIYHAPAAGGAYKNDRGSFSARSPQSANGTPSYGSHGGAWDRFGADRGTDTYGTTPRPAYGGGSAGGETAPQRTFGEASGYNRGTNGGYNGYNRGATNGYNGSTRGANDGANGYNRGAGYGRPGNAGYNRASGANGTRSYQGNARNTRPAHPPARGAQGSHGDRGSDGRR